MESRGALGPSRLPAPRQLDTDPVRVAQEFGFVVMAYGGGERHMFASCSRSAERGAGARFFL